jgi:hypothetical protein
MREVLLTGTVARQTAEEVFRVATDYLGPFLRRMPDGEVGGWGGGAVAAAISDPLLRPGEPTVMTTADTPFGAMQLSLFYPRDEADPSQVELAPSGVAKLKLDSYEHFRRLKAEGVIPTEMRFVFTIPGPATTGGVLGMRYDLLSAAAERVTNAEIDEIVAAIPAEELTVQIDLAVEVEMEELRRRPTAFDAPIFREMDVAWGDWTYQEVAASVARIANRVPPGVELGFHLCGMWHIDPRGGQDMHVHVDFANALSDTIKRRIDYVHIASVPDHEEADYRVLTELRLPSETKVFLGLIHGTDGLEGATRRVAAASAAGIDFGVGHFCGLGPLFGVTPDRLDDILELHRQVAEL